MTVVYIGGPYNAPTQHEVELNIRAAEALALKVWRLGAVPVCPHTMTRFYGDSLPRAVWLAGDLELLRRSDALLLVKGWEESAGTRAEVECAAKLHIPTFERLEWLARWLKQGNPDVESGLPL